ncbi:MAG: MT-A70 family methyltransferase, partial [Corallococcus sp.]|nr:MT-A70 family methyltransferase [Corallococcus sp.]
MFTDIYSTDKKYSIIYADPPWQYNKRSNPNTKFGKGACGHYDLMTMQDIKVLPIPKIAAENCVLFLWVTFPHLKEQLKLFDAWGFRYTTLGF